MDLSRKELTCSMTGNIQPQSPQLVEQLWTDSGIKSGIGMHKLMSTLKKKKKEKKAQAGNEWSNIIPKSSQVRKKPSPHPTFYGQSVLSERASESPV